MWNDVRHMLEWASFAAYSFTKRIEIAGFCGRKCSRFVQISVK